MKKTLPDGNKTLYIGGIYEVDKTPGGAVKRTVTYYPAAGATPALQRTQCGASVRINTVGGSNSVYYILKDHLGSASVVTDSTGAIVSGSEQRYCEAPLWGYPYGESRLTGTMLIDKLFTGQRDVGLGIYHYGARLRAAFSRHLHLPDIGPSVIGLKAYVALVQVCVSTS